MVETLGWLHSIDPDSIGLEGYGKKTGFYQRHCNTFSRIEAQQRQVKNIKTGKLLGRAHENYDEIIEYVRKNLPGDRFSIVHGDFKFDNVVSANSCHNSVNFFTLTHLDPAPHRTSRDCDS